MTSDELNKWLAVNVFKWEERDAYHGSTKREGITFWVSNGSVVTPTGPSKHHAFPKYTDGERFQKLLETCAEKCREEGQTLSIRRNCNCWDVFSRDHYDRHSVQAAILPLALSQFAFVLFGGELER